MGGISNGGMRLLGVFLTSGFMPRSLTLPERSVAALEQAPIWPSPIYS